LILGDNELLAKMNEEKKTELSHEVEIANTDHHKQIIKARNEFYE
jgi:hypothetical protein